MTTSFRTARYVPKTRPSRLSSDSPGTLSASWNEQRPLPRALFVP